MGTVGYLAKFLPILFEISELFHAAYLKVYRICKGRNS